MPDTSLLYGEHWEVAMWRVPLPSWPSGADWQRKLTGTLQAVIDGGARVAWIGHEVMPFSAPPWLFLPEDMQGAVPAWMTDDGRQGGTLDPDLTLTPATAPELRALRSYAEGLADVS